MNSLRPLNFCIGLLTAALLMLPEMGRALTIDTFEGGGEVRAQESFGSEAKNFITDPEIAIGGSRSVYVEATSAGTGEVVVTMTGTGFFDHSQTAGFTGYSSTHWDGDLNPNSINYVGLGGVDLTEGGGTAIVLKALSYDWPAGQPATVKVTIYDANDPSGETRSTYQLVLNESINHEDQILPFDDFIASGSNGPAAFDNVGAIVLEVVGGAPATDLLIDDIRTNGICPLVPDLETGVFDDCGECIAPSDPSYNQSCLDCRGVLNGPALPGTGCKTPFPGICETGMFDNDCNCQLLQGPQVELCDGLDNNCDGRIDEAFPRLGERCGAGEGECAIEGTFVCGETGGLTCDAEFDLSDAQKCDIRIGCDGIPGSPLVQDECGICGGDGSSCAGCESVDISEIQFELDGGAKFQERLIIRATRKLRRARPGRKKIRTFVRSTRELAHELQLKNWVLSWTLPTISTTCPQSEFCVETSNIGILEDYRQGSIALRDLGLQTVRRLKRVTSGGPHIKRQRKRMRRAHNNNLTLASTVPTTQSVCSGPIN